ncbi:2-dehydro-3-deoxyphosphogluconate aldolase [Clostridium acetobutylicum]|nr:2-dehydro-3-deoxyphosphogluconate aldolase [Clostridium acetobutylicum]
MNKNEIKAKMKGKAIAVVRCSEFSLAEKMSKRLISQGIDTIEVTYSVKDAGKLIKALKDEYPNSLIGAGTVVTAAQAKEAIDYGADFIVSPCIVEEVCEYCVKNDIACSQGTATPTEAFKAASLGADIIKIFPGSSFKPSYIKELKGPFPDFDCMPTGGVSDSNVKEWFDNGAFAVGLGGYFTKNITEDNLKEIDIRVKKVLDALKNA